MIGEIMRVRFGYVALPITIEITSSSTITYTSFQKREDGLKVIDQLIRKNLQSLMEILKYNVKNGIHFYRLTSNLIPLATLEEVDFDYITPYLKEYQKIGDYIRQHQLRVDMHPDQYAVLNSTNPKVVKNTTTILEYHAHILDAMQIEEGKIILHVGSNQGGTKASLTRFQHNFQKLPPFVREKIIIENDDKVFGVQEVLSLCQTLKVPMVLDYHHFLCHNNGEKLETFLAAIWHTWDQSKWNPKVHFSSPKSHFKKEFRSHHDYIDVRSFLSFLELIRPFQVDVDVMIEAKKKDCALFRLVRELKYRTDLSFLDETSFELK